MKLCNKVGSAVLFCFLLTCFMARSAKADTITYHAVLSGAAESPTSGSPGIGFAIVTINTALQTIEVNVTFSGLVSPDTAAFIHCCTATAGAGNSGVATTEPGFPLGVTAGSFDHVFDLTAASTYSPAFVTAEGSVGNAETALLAGLAAGDAYFNIHTMDFPAGEIRGFFPAAATATTPEPSSVWLIGIGLLALVGATKFKL